MRTNTETPRSQGNSEQKMEGQKNGEKRNQEEKTGFCQFMGKAAESSLSTVAVKLPSKSSAS